MLVQEAIPKHGSSSPITLKGFCFKHEHTFERLAGSYWKAGFTSPLLAARLLYSENAA